MHEDAGYARYFAYLNLFVFFMLIAGARRQLPGDVRRLGGRRAVLLPADRVLVQREGRTPTPGKKAFIVNRIGDFGFLVAMFLIFQRHSARSTSSGGVRARRPRHSPAGGGAITAIAPLPVPGCAGKSAQIPLYVWLPDAMAGSHARLRADPRRHDGDGRRVPGGRAATCSSRWRRRQRRWSPASARSPRCSRRPSASSSGTSRRCWRTPRSRSWATCSSASGVGAYAGGHLPSHDARVLQGAALPRRGQRHPRHAPRVSRHALARGRAGHAEHGRPAGVHAVDLRPHVDRHARDRRGAAVFGILLEGRDPRRSLRARPVQPIWFCGSGCWASRPRCSPRST